MTCPVCKRSDTAYLTCNRPDCTDGRHIKQQPAALSTPAIEPQGYADSGLIHDDGPMQDHKPAARPAPQPAAWAWDADGFLQPAADTRVDYAAALSYASSLAETLHEKHYSRNVSWNPMPDLLGLLTQIDNMVAGIIATPAPSDKIAEAARVVADAVDVDMLFFNREAFNFEMSMDMPVNHFFAQALRKFADAMDRALAGQGETP